MGASLREVIVSDKTTWRFLTLTDDEGNVGTGEFTLNAAPSCYVESMHRFARSLVGGQASRGSLKAFESMLVSGIDTATHYSAAEQALADIEAKAAQMSLVVYLGGRGATSVPLYANINRRTVDRTPSGFRQSACRAVDRGFSRIKIAPFDGLSPDLLARGESGDLVRVGLDRIAAVREVVGAGQIMVDCHWRFSADAVAAIIPELRELGVVWLECPIPELQIHIDEIKRIRWLANAAGMSLAGLETHAQWAGMRPFVEAGAYDVVMPDIKHCGGHGHAREIAARCAEVGTRVSMHNPSGPISHAASLHATAALDQSEPLELQFDESVLFHDAASPVPQISSGVGILPSGLGLGVFLKD